ncbi:PIG-L family deacetylase [Streptomyces sp. 71268]|uniref:sugar-binding protein n=1 Tax=Streptomyces sp. 71268 TaxID=3002640 RepID=UPI0023F9C704|nr:sugar-binding protein [Streptomyces sp. 71268]WEV25209.1 PIG-L family deacetylase [Streptomyces sp. 71268]
MPSDVAAPVPRQEPPPTGTGATRPAPRRSGRPRRRGARGALAVVALGLVATCVLGSAPASATGPDATHPAAGGTAAIGTTGTEPRTGPRTEPRTGPNAVRGTGRGTERGRSGRAHHDVLFIGAHPDDEYASLSTFGQWRERDGLSTGVVTITRGEGGGNAAGPQEGAPLGLLREREERDAVRHAGLRDVFYLDKPDFWYTLSAPLTARVWDGPPRAADTLERLVRLVRATTPRTIVTMDPRPFDQHGAHQLAGRLAVEAFQLAADPTAFPHQITREGYRPWQPSRLLAQNWRLRGPTGPACATTEPRDPATGLPQQGVWEGAWSSRHRTTWAQQERTAAREYVSQGFGALPEKITTPREKLGCDWFSVLAEDGEPVRAPVRPQRDLRPVFAEFRAWAERVGMPWLANGAQPAYPAAPATTVPAVATPPTVDGAAGPGEYGAGEELSLTHWQGERCAAADCAASARFVRHGDDLYATVRVADDVRGAALEASDCKRHWRTDAVEFALDPRGASDDTSTTFKAAVLPFTADGGACAARDADQHQGPAATTAPGMEWAARVSQGPYSGYTVEVRIPLRLLPAPVDPAALTANVLVYDSDTADRTGQSRLAWSAYGSAQADPYVWGAAGLAGYAPPGGQPVREPVIPLEAARSRDSLPSVLQSLRTGVPLAAGPRVSR